MYRQLIILITLCLTLASCEKSSSAMNEVPAVPVTVTMPTVRDVPQYIESIGVLEPSFFVEIRPQMDGIIEKIYAEEGALVEAGTPLFQLDAKSYHIKIDEAKAQLQKDQVTYDHAKKKVERFRSLAQDDLVSKAEWDEMEMQLALAEATLAMDHARLEAAKLDVDHCTLKAPKSGKIGRVEVYRGSLVSKGEPTPLTTISRSDPLLVNFSLTEKEFLRLPKSDLMIEVESLCEKGCHGLGKVVFLDHRFDSKSGSLLMRGELNNAENRLTQGQNVRVRIPVAVDHGEILIPPRAVKFNQQGPYVYVVSPENTVEFRQVILGNEIGEEVIVKEGIAATEPIVTSGHTRLSPGIKVEVQ
jgi:RND family efflux transporter MFP subunit